MLTDFLKTKKESNKIAIIYRDNIITYSQWYNYSNSIAYCISLFSKKRKNIGLYIGNNSNYLLGYFGVLFSDNIIVPIDIRDTNEEIKKIVSFCEIEIIITDNNSFEKISSLLIPNLKIIVVENAITYNKKIKQKNNEAQNVVLMLHSSGSTSNPKIVMLTNQNLEENVKSHIKDLGITSEDRFLVSLPVNYGYCNTTQILSSVYLGSKLIFYDELFSPQQFFEYINQYEITQATIVSSQLYLLNQKSNYKLLHNKGLKICFGGGYLDENTINSIVKKNKNIEFIHTYGLTECSPRVSSYHLFPNKLSKSVGKTIDNVNIMITDADSHGIGEILVSGPNVMKGYYKNENANNEILVNGWIKTGDLGYLDNGHLYLMGRKKNIIICGGKNIFPEELEAVILSCKYIDDVYVFAERNELLGEIPVAKIVPRDGFVEKNFKEYLNNHLSKIKHPRKLYYVNKIDKTRTGKTIRYRKEN